MACTMCFVERVCEVASQVGVASSKKMFGDWMIYIDEKPAILACDDIAYIKMLPGIAGIIGKAETACPYDGAKPHYILDLVHQQEAVRILQAVVPLLPNPKRRTNK